MRKALIVGIAAAATASAGCGQSRAQDGGPLVQRSYQVGSFDRIEVAGPYDVEVRTGAAPSVSARGPEKLLERLVVEVKGDRLLIHTKEHRGFFHWDSIHGSAKLAVTVPSLSGAEITGSGGITVDNVKGARFNGSVAGSGDLNLGALDVQSLKLSIGGSGDVRARSGRARDADYNIAGSGGIDASGIQTQTASASIAGSGDVTLTGGAKCSISKMGSGDANCS